MSDQYLNVQGLSELWGKTKSELDRLNIVSNIVNAPIGTIVIWSGTSDNIPDGWALCDGNDGRPDLRDKFVLGAGMSHGVGETGGAESVTLDLTQIPSHRHIQNISEYGEQSSYNLLKPNAFATASGRMLRTSTLTSGTGEIIMTNSSGGSTSHENMPPYYALCYIIKVSPDETDQPKTSVLNTPIGGIIAWSGTKNDVPDGWHICDGQDGTVDLRDKFILGAGTTYPIGGTGGEAKVTLTVDQMPSHAHIQRLAKDGDTASYYQVRSTDGVASGYVLDTSAVKVTNGATVGTTLAGSSLGHNNMPPYYTLLFIQKISESQTDYTTKEYVDEKSKQVYSEGETQIGTWIDGKPLYRKVVPITLPSAIATSSTIIGTMGTGCNVVKADGWWKSSSNAVQQIGHYVSLSTRTVFGYWHINADGSIRIIFNNSDMLNKEGWFVVEYTKTTEPTQLSEDGEVTPIDYNREDLE